MRHLKFISVAAALVALVACGKSDAEKQAEEVARKMEKAAEEMQKAAEAAEKGSPEAAAQGMEAFAKAMAEAAGAAAGPEGKRVEPVPFQQLETVLPDVAGWEREEPRSERMTSPMPFSQTEVTYSQGDAQIELKIVDSAFNQLLVSPWAMFMSTGYSRESSDGYEKSVTVGGNPGFEKWSTQDRSGELNLVVGKRFLVTVEGDNLSGIQVLHDFASKIDMAKLADLK